MTKKQTGDRVLSKGFEPEFKCGGCNYTASSAFYLASEGEPEWEEEGSCRLTHGVCAHCFMDLIVGHRVLMK